VTARVPRTLGATGLVQAVGGAANASAPGPGAAVEIADAAHAVEAARDGDVPAPAAAQAADAHAAIAEVARGAYGRLVAWLAWQWRDLAAAEDALADALVAALTHWPADGVPDKPEAWLLTAAKRRLLEHHRHRRIAESPEVSALFEPEPAAPEPAAVPDRRLELLFACTHPALDEKLHAPLMLQAVLGLDAKTIARAFLVAPSAMAQRLVRGKVRIREAGIPFDVPEPAQWPARVAAVLEAIYGAYTVGSEIAAPAPEAEPELRDEAVYLARLVAALLPENAPVRAEALGLLALLLYCESRRTAMFDGDNFVPLTQQDSTRWDRERLREAEGCLWQAARLRAPGPLQLEAAIQSAHCQRAATGHTPWAQIAQLYAALTHLSGSIGAHIGHAVALAESGDVAAARTLLEALDAKAVREHQPYWVARAHVLRLAGDGKSAEQARQRAIGLTADERVRRFLLGSLAGPS